MQKTGLQCMKTLQTCFSSCERMVEIPSGINTGLMDDHVKGPAIRRYITICSSCSLYKDFRSTCHKSFRRIWKRSIPELLRFCGDMPRIRSICHDASMRYMYKCILWYCCKPYHNLRQLVFIIIIERDVFFNNFAVFIGGSTAEAYIRICR